MGAIAGMPCWWCPWIHDVALLVRAATKGIFFVIPNKFSDSTFSPEAIQKQLQRTILAKEEKHPAARYSDPEQLAQWNRQQAKKFPSMFQLERRLAFLCSRTTADVLRDERFDLIPMFDHGAWPRN
jgi:hypothetical protein